MEGTWQAVVYEAYEEESDYMTTFLPDRRSVISRRYNIWAELFVESGTISF